MTSRLKIFFFIAISAFVTSCANEEPIKLEGLITSNGAGEITLGKSIHKITDRLNKEEVMIIQKEKNSFDIFENGERALSFWSKKQDSKIGFIEIWSNKFKTSNGISAGQSLNEIKVRYPNLKLIIDDMTGEYYIAPPELQTFDGIEPEKLCLFYVNIGAGSENLNFEWNKETNQFEAEIDVSGTINRILIFKWK